MENFEGLGLKPALMSALHSMGFTKPTEVQGVAIPEILRGKDVFVRAKTGTGKTAAFLLPIMQMMVPNKKPQVIVVLPTRELVLQVESMARKLGTNLKLGITTVYGGVSLRPQMDSIDRGTDIIVGTPGRIIDLMQRGNLNLEKIRYLVLDEADMMLDMGFIDDIDYIISSSPETRQTMLFSATARPDIRKLANRYMSDPVHLSVGADDELVVTSIKHHYALVERFKKFATLLAYMKAQKSGRSIIFVRTQGTATILHTILRDKHMAAILLHGGMTQASRTHAMKHFKEESHGILIATNIAARGLDISDVNDVINFDAPDDPTVYVHRVGRSARMGKDGKAFTIFTPDQTRTIDDIEAYSGIKMEKIHIDSDEFGRENFGKYFARSGRDRDRGDDRNKPRDRRPQFRGQRGQSYQGGGGQQKRRGGYRPHG